MTQSHVRVYSFPARISRDVQQVVLDEIERGQKYYNAMIAAVNVDLVGDGSQTPPTKGAAERIEEIAKWLWPNSDSEKRKGLVAKSIYRRVKKRALDVRAKFPALASGCYTGTYHAVQAAFDATMSAKRVGVWPGDAYRWRRESDNRGAMVGVHLQGGGYTWRGLHEGQTSLAQVTDSGAKYSKILLKVSKESGPIEASIRIYRPIPHDAVITHVMLCRVGTWGRKCKWMLRITAKTESTISAPKSSPVGVDIATEFSLRPDGSMLVACTSNGQELVMPAYAIRMFARNNEIESERDVQANKIKPLIPALEGRGQPKSAYGCALRLERAAVATIGGRAISTNASEELLEYARAESHLHATQDHVRNRAMNIRTDLYRKFVANLAGVTVYICKSKLKSKAEAKPRDDAWLRTCASTHALITLLRNSGAIEIERLGDDEPASTENADKILKKGMSGNVAIRADRKPLRKYRKSRRDLETAQNPMATGT